MKGEKVGSPASVSEVNETPVGASPAPTSSLSDAPRVKGGKRFDEWRCLRKTESPAWDKVIEDLAAEIKTRHYSRKTLKHYADWCRKFQSYLKHKPPVDLSSKEVIRTIQELLGHSDVRTTMIYIPTACRAGP